MSNDSGPVPENLHDEFVGHVDPYNDDDAPDGAWFCMIEDACRDFRLIHTEESWAHSADANSMAHQYFRLLMERSGVEL